MIDMVSYWDNVSARNSSEASARLRSLFAEYAEIGIDAKRDRQREELRPIGVTGEVCRFPEEAANQV